jgi:type IV pilus assembly protein PilC
MRLSLREKAGFYQRTAQLLRSGTSLPQSLERLSSTAGGSLRGFYNQLSRSLADGDTLSEALARTGTASEMEKSALAALERTGKMEDGLQQLAKYFEALNRARGEIIRGAAYPVFILHLGILLMNLPMLFTGAGTAGYLKTTGILLLYFYGAAAVIAVTVALLRNAGSRDASTDWMLRSIPLIGKIRRAFALSRFCSAYDMQLNAGVNVMDSLESAARASQSGMVYSAVEYALPHVRSGERVAPLLAKHRAFPGDMKQALLVAEDTGSLDQELPRLATEFQQEGFTRLGVFSEWMPRLIYFGVVGFLAWNIISGYKRYLDGVMSQFDSL